MPPNRLVPGLPHESIRHLHADDPFLSRNVINVLQAEKLACTTVQFVSHYGEKDPQRTCFDSILSRSS